MRYTLITYFNGKDFCENYMSSNSFPSRALIEKEINENGNELKSIVNIFEFKSKSDYEQFISGSKEDVELIEKPKVAVNYDKLMAYYNLNRGTMPEIYTISIDRKRKINLLANEYGTLAISKVFDKLKSIQFLQGDNEKGWVATFDWVIKQQNFIKILEGNYDTKAVLNKEIIKC